MPVSEVPRSLLEREAYSMHLHGKAGIQNSVLSLDSSNFFDIRVRRGCSIRGRLTTWQTWGTSTNISFSVLLPLRTILLRRPLPVFPNPSAALLPACLKAADTDQGEFADDERFMGGT